MLLEHRNETVNVYNAPLSYGREVEVNWVSGVIPEQKVMWAVAYNE